ncbi:MAG TPA: STING domain-containing protein, partial [Ohtaekwangia sp.]
LSELEPRNIERVIGRIRMKSFEDKIINLEFQEGRARDILTVTASNNKRVYFDFPNTLLSLNSLIDYKMESRKNRFSDSIRDEMAKDYIIKFKQVIQKLLEARDLTEYVFFVDKNLEMEL